MTILWRSNQSGITRPQVRMPVFPCCGFTIEQWSRWGVYCEVVICGRRSAAKYCSSMVF
uniref:Uncharacterized protein n=1 Tax=Octopus bimaculoides TaxID=37653 RepID=A0A0L8FMB8_OCTBM